MVEDLVLKDWVKNLTLGRWKSLQMVDFLATVNLRHPRMNLLHPPIQKILFLMTSPSNKTEATLELKSILFLVNTDTEYQLRDMTYILPLGLRFNLIDLCLMSVQFLLKYIDESFSIPTT